MDLMEYLDHHFIDLYLTRDVGRKALQGKGGSEQVTDDHLMRILRKSLPKAKDLYMEQQQLLLEQETVAEQTIAFDPLSSRHAEALQHSLRSLGKSVYHFVDILTRSALVRRLGAIVIASF